MKRFSIGIKGAYGEKNFGDDALQFFLVEWLRINQIEATFLGKESSYITSLFPSIIYLDKTKSHRHFFSTLILGGGTQFFSFSKTKRIPKLNSIYEDPKGFINKICLFLEKKLIFRKRNFNQLIALGIGIGPFIEDLAAKEQARQLVRSMNSIYVRDQFSYRFAKQVNLNTFQGTDLCFLPNIIDFKSLIKEKKEIEKIGIIVRDWPHMDNGISYIERIVEEANILKNNNYNVEFVFFGNEKKCDLLLENQDFKILRWEPKSQGIVDFIDKLSDYSLLISARFHGVIFGSLLNIPSIAIEIEPKLKLTNEILGKGVFVWKQPFNQSLLEIVTKIKYSDVKKELIEARNQQSLKAKQMMQQLLAQLK